MPGSASRHGLALRALIVAGLVAFGLFLAGERGLVSLALRSDRSYISYFILLIYGVASAHWGLLVWRLSSERDRLARIERGFEDGATDALALSGSGVRFGDEVWGSGYLASFLRGLLLKRSAGGDDGATLVSIAGEQIANRHAPGHFAAATLLKLGLLGTIVGFILMLLPVSRLTDFEPALAQQLLREMSGGMAVALYTTLAGLVTSTLLELQYQILDTSAQDFLNRLAFLADVAPAAPEAEPARGT